MLLTLGQRLKAAREARGFSLADAAHETRVPAQRLQHLESDNIAAFGSMTYARSFLKLYSDFLQVDASDELSELPPAMLGGSQDYRYLTESYGTWLRERRKPTERLAEPAYSSRVHAIKSPVPAGIAVFLCVLAFAGLYGKYVATMTEQHDVQNAAETPAVLKQPVSLTAPLLDTVAVPAKSEPAVQIQPAIRVEGL